jgi:2-haloacid dehalogenase
VGVFKPHPSVYQLVPTQLGLPKEAICFISANGWDAWSAKAFGLQVLWFNRSGTLPKRLPANPDGELEDLGPLPDLLR